MGAISKLLGAGVKQAAKKSGKKSLAKLQAELKDVKERLAKDPNGPRADYYRNFVKSHERSIKQAKTGTSRDRGMKGFGGTQATKTGKPNKAMQKEATKQAKTDQAISKAKKKEGRYNKRRSELKERFFKDQDNQSRIGDADYEVQKAAAKNKKELDKLQKVKEAEKTRGKAGSSKTQSRDFLKSGTSKKKQASKASKKKIKKTQDKRRKAYGDKERAEDLLDTMGQMQTFKKQAD